MLTKMSRYRQYGGLDDPRVEDGDIGFRGVNLRDPAWQLGEGMLSLSENGRIDGEWIPRRGCRLLTDESLTTDTSLRLAFWIVDTTGGKTVSAGSRVDEVVSLTVTGHGFPVSAENASVIVNPTGVDNSILYTADIPGSAGADISIEYVDGVSGSVEEIISVDGNAITITLAEKAGMDVFTTFANPNMEGIYLYAGQVNGLPSYTTDGTFTIPGSGTWYQILSITSVGDEWYIHEYTNGVLTDSLPFNIPPITGPVAYPSPDLVGGAIAGINPIVSSGQQVIDAVNADPISSSLVTASASGTVTGPCAAVGPVFLQGGSTVSSYLTLEGVSGSPTVDPNGSYLMTATDANTLTFEISGASGSETYTVTSAKVLARIDDFSTTEVLASCVFSDPSSDNNESIFLAYSSSVRSVDLSTGGVTDYGLPVGETIPEGSTMIQAMDKVFVFRGGLVALQWEVGDTDFALVTNGTYTQPQVFSVASADADVTSGLAAFTVTGNTTIAAGDTITIYGSTDEHFIPFIGQSFYVTAATSTLINFYIPVSNHDGSGHSDFVEIGKRVSVGGGLIHQPGFPWATYFQRRLWGPYQYRWDTSLTPDAFTSRDVTDELIASDILDPDTFDPLTNQFRITGGTADYLVSVHPFYNDILIVLMRNSIHSISGTVGSLSDASVKELTREVGCIARKSVVSQGNGVFFLSDNGVYGLSFSDEYNLRGLEKPLSERIQPYIDRISVDLAPNAVGVYHDNRYWLAVPLDSAPKQGDATGNNAILIYNLLNNEWEGVDTFSEPEFQISDLLIAGGGARNELYAVSPSGGIYILNAQDEEYDEIATTQSAIPAQYHIPATLRTRAYLCGTLERKRFADFSVQMKAGSSQSSVDITLVTDDPDSDGESMDGGLISPMDTADIRIRAGGVRGFNGALTIQRTSGRPSVRGTRISATVTNRATITHT